MLEAASLTEVPPLNALRTLRDFYRSKCTIAFFQNTEISIIGFDPEEIIQIKGEDPFAVIQKKIKARQQVAAFDIPFFQGGALGYFSYDSVRFLESKLILSGHEPRYDAEVVFFKNYLVFDRLKQKVFFYSGSVSLPELEKIILNSKAAHAKAPLWQSSESKPLPVAEMRSSLGKAQFIAGIHQLKQNIIDGDIFQAVLSDRFSISFQGDPLPLFETLSRLSPAPYQFYFEIDRRVYLGASPEMLLKVMKGDLESHPIAGTRPRGQTPIEDEALAQDLLSDEKEKAEHLMLVDLSRNDIGRVSLPGSVSVDSFMKVKNFGGVMHLVSSVKGKLKPELSSIEALASCFPAGTLSGAPKIRAMELIANLERSPRNFYGGAFIAASVTGDLDSCINIRSISIEDEVASVQAGAGIVADSVPELEYEEILAKSSLPRQALAIAISGQAGVK